ncbi:late expression factor 10 [Alphabaculovirus altersperidaniae]|uniref:Late expression factor 10 n=1 Tax=Spodoptera eridania nucleopolyhedrovirus TaxID=2315721 RepID=A0ABX6TQK3_9ABAC|nr:late expression factor 10 [Spodoptera eridania nucleopolyhedrovirus]QNV47899.1 late expression factor 10 [Spodoptera eridania nucleopolyhedrovirus]
MSSDSIANDVLNAILKDNLELVDNSYIILNVVDYESGAVKPVCIGEIDSFQTAQSDKYTVSDSSVSSELQSDQTL